LKNGHVDLKKLIKLLGKRNIASLMIEGGATLNAAALNSGIVDKIMFFYAPGIAGGDDSLGMVAGQGPKRMADATKVTNLTIRRIKNDFMVEGYLK
jgi:diaminohydroxyphosphoribosylaminopyrimidine deaminase/5-amino-6-(5-phosphoribosylamino)uracil reductase